MSKLRTHILHQRVDTKHASRTSRNRLENLYNITGVDRANHISLDITTKIFLHTLTNYNEIPT